MTPRKTATPQENATQGESLSRSPLPAALDPCVALAYHRIVPHNAFRSRPLLPSCRVAPLPPLKGRLNLEDDDNDDDDDDEGARNISNENVDQNEGIFGQTSYLVANEERDYEYDTTLPWQ